MKRDYYKDSDFYGDIDVRLQDYHNHSREWGFVDRIPEEVSVHVSSVQIPIDEHTSSGVVAIAEENARMMKDPVDRIPTAYSDFRKVGEVTANGSEVVERGSCTWDITIETFPIGDEI